MDILTIKIVGGLLLWLSMVIFGILPLFYKKFRSSPRLLSFCNCFSGGLFVSIGLIHILPEAHELLDEAKKSQMGQSLGEDMGGVQWSYFICLMSFSSILFLDKILFNNSDLADDENPEATVDLRMSLLGGSMNNTRLNPDQIQENFKERISSKYKVALRLSRNSRLSSKVNENRFSTLEFQKHDSKLEKPKMKIIRTEDYIEDIENPSNPGDTTNDTHKDDLTEPLVKRESMDLLEIQNKKNKELFLKSQAESNMVISIKDELNKDVDPSNIKEHKHSHGHEGHEGHQHQVLVSGDESILTSIILLMAMGIHGFFSMMAFGIEKKKTNASNLFIALIFHKWSEALTVGKQIYYNSL